MRNALALNTGQIVFTSMRDGNTEIYVMDADGGNQENLTNHPAHDGEPDWSPDGTKIAFVSGRDGSPSQIHVMDADGKNPIRLTDGPGEKRHPDWSPDGQKIAFVHGEIYVIGVGGQGRKKVTHDLVGKWSPSFSPDGRRIAYDAGQEGFSHIYVVGADGRNRKRLTHNQEHHSLPTWSPDGQTIAYAISDGRLFGAKIHLMTADGQYLKQLSKVHDGIDYQPDFSPVGLAVSPSSNKITTWVRLKKLAPNRR